MIKFRPHLRAWEEYRSDVTIYGKVWVLVLSYYSQILVSEDWNSPEYIICKSWEMT